MGLTVCSSGKTEKGQGSDSTEVAQTEVSDLPDPVAAVKDIYRHVEETTKDNGEFGSGVDLLELYASAEFQEIVRQVRVKDMSVDVGYYIDFDFWYQAQDVENFSTSDFKLHSISPDNSKAVVDFNIHNCGNTTRMRVQVVYQDNKWKVNDFINRDQYYDIGYDMTEYILDLPEATRYETYPDFGEDYDKAMLVACIGNFENMEQVRSSNMFNIICTGYPWIMDFEDLTIDLGDGPIWLFVPQVEISSFVVTDLTTNKVLHKDTTYNSITVRMPLKVKGTVKFEMTLADGSKFTWIPEAGEGRTFKKNWQGGDVNDFTGNIQPAIKVDYGKKYVAHADTTDDLNLCFYADRQGTLGGEKMYWYSYPTSDGKQVLYVYGCKKAFWGYVDRQAGSDSFMLEIKGGYDAVGFKFRYAIQN